VRLLFASAVATYIRERVWHASQELRPRRDGSLELRLQTSSRKELSRWILSWMPHVKVLSPRQLQDRVCRRTRHISNMTRTQRFGCEPATYSPGKPPGRTSFPIFSRRQRRPFSLFVSTRPLPLQYTPTTR
jgi:hypothetical protein